MAICVMMTRGEIAPVCLSASEPAIHNDVRKGHFILGFLAQRIASKRTTTATATINILLFLLRRLEDLRETTVREEVMWEPFIISYLE